MDNIKCTKVSIVAPEEERERTQKISEEVIAENFPKVGKGKCSTKFLKHRNIHFIQAG